MGRILVAEDDHATATALHEMLALDGHSVKVVYDGDAAMEAHADERPDLMIVDVMMPGTDGLTACREIRKRDARVLIMIMTAHKRMVDTDMSVDAGADDFLPKPFGANEFLARVKSLLRRKDR